MRSPTRQPSDPAVFRQPNTTRFGRNRLGTGRSDSLADSSVDASAPVENEISPRRHLRAWDEAKPLAAQFRAIYVKCEKALVLHSATLLQPLQLKPNEGHSDDQIEHYLN